MESKSHFFFSECTFPRMIQMLLQTVPVIGKITDWEAELDWTLKAWKGLAFYCVVETSLARLTYHIWREGNSMNHMQVCKDEEAPDTVAVANLRLSCLLQED